MALCVCELWQEELFGIAMTLIGACVQATVFGQFAHLIASLDGQATQFKRQISGIVDTMRYHDFPESLNVSGVTMTTIPHRTALHTHEA